ncbi:pyruvoyl-dependent arginine decarboxylase [Limnochorda pilosa]|uniref:Pyruvoyl-dependent arginine decarboxylase AaxB n=1 Tax=Limnochorda pilosa TaxID=1555112 RepID=A0A0K2SFN7_LIMPI|nr:arginine decarboxylase, pyruvoyl-dependent [Limnochorda pilosa]BAS25905.1 pyruvoyl-dependent arginine decarboxylase [Limnochorda pilosa]
MLPTPSVFCLAAGDAEGETPLTAFDGALLRAGVGNVNLLRVSSILPPRARQVERVVLSPGALVPIAYGSLSASEPGVTVAAAVAAAPGEPGKPGVIVEHALRGSRADAEAAVTRMARECFGRRGEPEPERILVASAEHRVEVCGCAFAGVVLWYHDAPGMEATPPR